MADCKQCGKAFTIPDDDLKFYEKVSPEFGGTKYIIPPPDQCPSCRHMHRYSFRNEWCLSKRKCDKTGKEIVATYSSDEQMPVYDNEEWWGDSWDAFDYGQDIDFNRPFFEQFFELVSKVPKMARIQQGENINSEFTNCVSYNRNCYLISSANNNEDCQYGTFINHCTTCLNNHHIHRCELSMYCLNCSDCYHAIACRDCTNCSDVAFCKSCIGCKNCIGCVNMQNKEYCYFNKQISKEEYKEKLREIEEGKDSTFNEMQKKLNDFVLKQPHRFYEGTNNQNSTGNYIWNTKNSIDCYDCEDMEDCKYCSRCILMKDCYDIDNYGCTEINELLLEGEGLGHGVFKVIFSKLIWGGSNDVLYSYECFASKHLFGCAGLKRAEYCILNKKYSPEEYEELAGKLIEHMKGTGEWGKFFPAKYSPFGYNETVAQAHYPLTKEEALERGYKWKEISDEIPEVEKIILAEDLPDSINDIPDDILNWALKCKETDRPYLINKRELEFCRQLKIPIPRFHPDIRHQKRMDSINRRELWKRECDKCGKAIETTYSPDRPEIVYCEECYRAEVY